MRGLIFIATLLFLISCQDNDKNYDGSSKNYVRNSADTNCINPWSDAFFEFKSIDIDSVTDLINAKIVSVLGSSVYNEKNQLITKDSVRKTMFSFDSAFIRGDVEIDTVNLLLLKDDLNHFISSQITPGKFDGTHILTQKDLFTFQIAPKFEIGIEFYPCIKKILNHSGKFKWVRRNQARPEFASEASAFIDKINAYNCIMSLSIHLQIDDKSKIFNSRRQFYEIKMMDSCTVFASVDLLNPK